MISGISNSDLSIQPSKNAVFSRRFACFVFQPYVSALVFALTNRNKGKFLLYGHGPVFIVEFFVIRKTEL